MLLSSNRSLTVALSGHYVSLQVSHDSEGVVVSYPRAGYSCGLTFSYYLTGGGGVSLILRTSSGTVLWTSPSTSAAWEVVGLSDSQYLTSGVDEGVEFALTSVEGNGSVALDNVVLNFCLPCDFGGLETSDMLELSYDNSSRIYLRTPQTIHIEVATRSIY